MASCSDDATARIWHLDDIICHGAPAASPKVLRGHTQEINNILWHPKAKEMDHPILATSVNSTKGNHFTQLTGLFCRASVDGTCRLWDSISGDCIHTFDEKIGKVYTIAWSPDGRWLVTGTDSGWTNVYSTEVYTFQFSILPITLSNTLIL